MVIYPTDTRDTRLRGISCFTGINGIDLGLQEWVRTVCYIEWDKFCQQLLLQHIREGVVDNAPLWDNICTFDGEPWRGRVDLVFGGFPCTPHSIAGRRLGSEDSRDMWPDTIRILRQIRPGYVFLENVAGLEQPKKKEGTPAYLGRVLGDLAESGYDAVKISLRASDVGAPHRRERIFVLANTISKRLQGRELLPECTRERTTRQGSMGYSPIEGLPDWAGGTVAQPSPLTEFERPSGWETISIFRRIFDELSSVLDNGQRGLNEEVGSGEVLSLLWNKISSQALQWGARKHELLSETKLLQSNMCTQQEDYYKRWLSETGKGHKTANLLRELWKYRKAINSSSEQELGGQFSIKLADAVFFVSHIVASATGRLSEEEIRIALYSLWKTVLPEITVCNSLHEVEKTWESLSSIQQDCLLLDISIEVERIGSYTVPMRDRVRRLKALGNSCVPLQAKVAFYILWNYIHREGV